MKSTTKITIFVSIVLLIVLSLILVKDNNEKALDIIKPKTDEATAEIKIIAFGDSLTAGYGLALAESYPAQLEVALKQARQSVEVINSGVVGETTKGNLERAKFIRSQTSDIVILGIGGNDALRLLPIEETIKNIDETISILKSGDDAPVVILLQMQAPLTAGLGYKQKFDVMYEDLATKYKIPLVPFLTAELFLDKAYKLPDGIHYNQAGYAEAVKLYILPVTLQVIEKLNS